MRPLLLIVIVSISVFIACKKTPRHATIDESLKAHFNYKVGSYWIYKDSISGQEDSFYVTNNVFSSSQVSDEEISDGININIVQKDIYLNTNDTVSWLLQLNSNVLSLSWTDPESVDLRGKLMQYSPFVMYPFKITAYGGINNVSGSVTNILSNYSINGNSFYNVAQIHDTLINNVTAYTFSDWFYLSDSIGIVKMRINHPPDTINRVWEIERWNIVK